MSARPGVVDSRRWEGGGSADAAGHESGVRRARARARRPRPRRSSARPTGARPSRSSRASRASARRAWSPSSPPAPARRARACSPATASTSATASWPTRRSSARCAASTPASSAAARRVSRRCCPSSTPPRPAHESALSQGRVFELLLGLLGRLAEAQPLVLVFEDVHWADRSSRDFLAFFVRNARHQRVLLVATYRTDELHRRHPLRALVAEAERAPIVERVALERFTREEMVAQLTGILGPPARGAPGRRALRPRRGQPVLHRGAGGRRHRRAPAGQRRRRAHAARRGAEPARPGRAAPRGRRRARA